MSDLCGGSSKRASADEPNIPLCISIQMNSEVKISNRIYGFSKHDTWKEILAEIVMELDKADMLELKTTKGDISVQLSSKLHGSEIFYPDIEEEIEVVRQFDKSLKYVTFKICSNKSDSVRGSQCVNAFDHIMRSRTVCEKSATKKATNETKFTAKEQLYNDLVDLLKQRDCYFPNSMSDSDVMKNVYTLVNALWLIDNGNLRKLQQKIAALKNNNQESEIRLLKYCGYHDFKKTKKKTPRLSAVDLKSHSTALFQLISLPFVSSWHGIKNDILELAKCFNIYADQLDKANEEQQYRQNLSHPVREISKDALLYYVPQTQKVLPRYAILDTCLAKMNYYEYVFFDEFVHVEEPFRTNFDRYDFVQKIALSMPVNVLKYNPGGSVGASVFIWRVPTDRNVQEIINEGTRTIEKLKPRLLEYHTRRMKSDFTRKYTGLNACQTPKHILRSIYKELTNDASVDQNPSIEYRIQEAISSEDPDLVIDLRHLNTGRPGDTFQVFFDLLRAKVEEQCAADERRHNIEHVARYISISDLIKDVSADLPTGTPIPSESTVLFSFAPKNAYIRTARLYKSVIPLQFKVQTRQLRLSHQDEHYCASQYKYMRHFANIFKDYVTFLSIDDKSKIDIGEPGQYISSGVRGKKSLVPAASQLSAMDHDVSSKGSITPSVILNVALPEDKDGSFYQGHVSVIFKDSIFQPSSPFRHAAEMQKMLLNELSVHKPVLMIYSDGGPDHRLTYHSVKLSLIVLFRNLNLDMLIAGRTAPGHSWANPVERIMSVLNLSMQNMSLARNECDSNTEHILKSANTMAEIRKKSEKVPGLKEQWVHSLDEILNLLQNRTRRLTLKEVPFKCPNAATDEAVKAFEEQIQQLIDNTIESGQYQQKHLTNKEEYQRFLENHCRQRQYTFQIRKCNDPECCSPMHLPDLPWLPDPIPTTDKMHYKPLMEVVGQPTTDSERPSAKKSTPTAVAEELQGVKNSFLIAQNVRSTVTCCECGKIRCIYSKKTLTLRDTRTLARTLEKYDYTCGALLIPEGDVLHGKVFVRMQLNCTMHMEFAYYAEAAKGTRKDLCCYCASTDVQKNQALLKKFRVVLPVCTDCLVKGLEIPKRNPMK